MPQPLSTHADDYKAELEKANKKLADIEAKQKKDAEDKLIAENKFKELYESATKELEPTKKEVERLRKLEDSVKKKLLEAIPKEKREMFNSLSIEQLEVISDGFKITTGTSAGISNASTTVTTGDAINIEAQALINEVENGTYDKKKISELARKFEFKGKVTN